MRWTTARRLPFQCIAIAILRLTSERRALSENVRRGPYNETTFFEVERVLNN